MIEQRTAVYVNRQLCQVHVYEYNSRMSFPTQQAVLSGVRLPVGPLEARKHQRLYRYLTHS